MPILVRTPSPFSTECLCGYVLRVSEINGYRSPRPVLDIANIPIGHMNSPLFSTTHFEGVLARESQSLEKISYKKKHINELSIAILGHELINSIRRNPLQLKKPHFCPYCVQDNGYIDAFWRSRLAVACPQHGCEPLFYCQECRRYIDWFRPGLLTCRCGADFSKVRLKKSDQPTVELMGILQAKLHRQDLFAVPNSYRFPLNKLEPLSLSQFMRVCELIADQIHPNLVIKEKRYSRSALETVAGACELLMHWPEGYHHLLNNFGLMNTTSSNVGRGFWSKFNSFYWGLRNNPLFFDDAIFLCDQILRFGYIYWNDVNAKLPSLEDRETFSGQSEIGSHEI